MSAPTSTSAPVAVRLPMGHIDRSGRVHRDALVRKMTGYEEALLYEIDANPGRLVTGLLAACMVRLGEIDVIDHDLVADLYLGDRNHLLLQLRRVTLGNQLVAHYCCPHCEATVRVVEDLSTLPVNSLEEDELPREVTVELDDGYRDPEETVHREVTLSPPRGSDEEVVGIVAARDPVRARDALLLRCIRTFGTIKEETLSGLGVDILRSLSLGDRYRLVQALNDITLGPDFRRRVKCDNCASEFDVLLDASSFFDMG